MPHKTEHVANIFLQKAFPQDRHDITLMKLQKLVYCLNGWHLAITDWFEAWPYGPVVENLYHKFKEYGSRPIDNDVRDLDPVSGRYEAYVVGDSDKQFHEIFEAVWSKYNVFSAIQLSALTHQNEKPWEITKASGKTIIDNELIKEHFKALAS